jgi:ferric enterobactin receptor
MLAQLLRVCRRMVSTLLVVFLLCLEASLGQASSIQGIVKDAKTGERLPSATVMVKGTKIGAKTNLEGFFLLPSVPDTSFVLQVRFVGYAPQDVSIDPRSQTGEITIALKAREIQVEGVTITAEQIAVMKTESEPSLASISPREIMTLPNAGQADIFRSMQLLPGISATNERSSGLYVRGGTPDQTLILFDGMNVYHVDHFFGFFSAFSPDAIKNVEFYKGGYPAMYGGRLSSVVDMAGKAGDPEKFHLGIGASLLSANGKVEVPLFDKGSFLVAARRSFGDIIQGGAYQSLYEFITGSSSTTQRPRITGGPGGGPGAGGFGGATEEVTPLPMFYDLNAKATYPLTPRDVVSASLYSSMDDLDKSQDASTQSAPGGGFQVSIPSTVDDSRQKNLGVSGRWFHQWGPEVFSNLLLSTTKYTSSYKYGMTRSNPGGTTQDKQSTNEDNSVVESSIRLDNQWTVNEDHEVSVGAQMSSTSVAYSLAASTSFNQDVVNLLGMNQRSMQTVLYAQDKWKVVGPLDVTGGIRATMYNLTNKAYIEPRLSWRLTLTDLISLKGAYGIYHQFSNRIINEDLTQGSRDFWLLADPALQPGRADHYILGATFETEQFVFDVEGYYKNYSNLVEFSRRFRRTPDDLYSFYTGSGIARGFDFLLQKKVGAFNGWIGYTLGKVDNTFAELNNGNPFPAEQDQRHELKLVGSLDLGSNWTVSSTFIFGSGTPYTAPISQYSIVLLDSSSMQYTHVSDKNTFRLPSYQRLDLSVSKRFGEKGMSHWLVGLSCFNVLNHKNISYYEYDLNSNPVTVTAVTGLGVTPTLFVQVEFK